MSQAKRNKDLASESSEDHSATIFVEQYGNPAHWSIDDVSTWLAAIGFEEYVKSFKKERINGEFLLDYVNDAEILNDLGVRKQLHQRRLYYELHKLINIRDIVDGGNPVAVAPAEVLQNSTSNKEVVDPSNEDVNRDQQLRGKKRKHESTGDDRDDIDNVDRTTSSDANQNSSSKEIADITIEHTAVNKVQRAKVEVPVNLEKMKPISFEVATTSKARCKVCAKYILRDNFKLGCLDFFKSGMRTFPVSWCVEHHLLYLPSEYIIIVLWLCLVLGIVLDSCFLWDISSALYYAKFIASLYGNNTCYLSGSYCCIPHFSCVSNTLVSAASIILHGHYETKNMPRM